MDYLLKSSICITAFYGLYFFGFRRLSFHSLNRFYLLVSLALSLTIPMLSYEREEVVIVEPSPTSEITYSEEKPTQSFDNQTFEYKPQVIESQEIAVDWMQVLSIIYLLGVIIMLLLFIRNLILIVQIVVSSPPFTSTSLCEQIRVLVTERSRGNASFFNYIFINPDNLNPHEQALIIDHESFHAKQLHTLDLLLLGVLKAIFWFNPIIYFYQKSLKQIHEYEVDALMSATHDSREYAHLLLKLGVAPNAMIINQFSTKPLSDRIQFLFKTPTKNMKKLLYFLSIPIIGVGVMAFAQEKVNMVYKEKEGTKTLKSIEVKEYPLLINDKMNYASWTDAINKPRFTPQDISLNTLTTKNYNGFHYLVNPNSLTISMIEKVNKFIKNRSLALIVTESENDKKGNITKLGLAIKHLSTKQMTNVEVFDMNELRERGKNGAFIFIEAYDKNFKESSIAFKEGTGDLFINQGEKSSISIINKTSDLDISSKRITYKVSPDKLNLLTLQKVKAYFAKEGFTLTSKNEAFDKNHNLVSLTIQLDNGKEKSEKQVVLNDLRHLIRLKTESKDKARRWDENLVIVARKDTKNVKVDYEGKWFEGFEKSGKYEILEVVTNNIHYQLDSTKFTYYLSVRPKKRNIDSFVVIVNNKTLVEGRDFIVKGEGIYVDERYKGTRPSFRIYMKAMGGPLLYPQLAKLDEVYLPKLNHSSKAPVFLASNNNKLVPQIIKSPSSFSQIAKNRDTLRTILETNKLGKNPLVIINDIEYPSSILYRINPNSTQGSIIYQQSSPSGIKKYGERATDGVVILNTIGNKELVLENDKQHRIAVDNVKKQLNAPKKRIQKVILKDLDGKEYEKVSVMRQDLTSSHFSVDIPVGGKIIYYVDGKIVSEKDIENGNQIYDSGGCGETPGGEYDAYFKLYIKRN